MTALVDIAVAMKYLGASVDDTDIVQLIIDAVSEQVEQFLGWRVLTAEYVTTLNGAGSRAIMLPNYPIQSVSAVGVYDQVVPVAPNALAGGFRFDTNTVYLNGPYRFDHGRQNVTIAYKAGYNAVPPDIQLAVLEWSRESWALSDSTRDPNLNSRRAGDTEEKYSTIGSSFTISQGLVPMPGSVYAKLRPRQRVYPA